MNILKHMEALFLVAALAIVGTTYASAESYKAQVRADSLVSSDNGRMAVVKVTARRVAPATRFG